MVNKELRLAEVGCVCVCICLLPAYEKCAIVSF